MLRRRSLGPYVRIRVLLAAVRTKSDAARWPVTGGITEMSAPESIKNCRPERVSVTKTRQLWFAAVDVDATAALASFPT